MIDKAALEIFRKWGKEGGEASGKARMEKLTPEQRSEIAKKAAAKSAEVRSAKAKKKAAVKSTTLKKGKI